MSALSSASKIRAFRASAVAGSSGSGSRGALISQFCASATKACLCAPPALTAVAARCASRRGKRTQKVVPRPSSLSTLI